jgi:hypothetical protein
MIQPQQQTNWCWAAVSTSVSIFFSAASGWTQCLVANSALPRPDCCAGGASDMDRCNKPWFLDTALTVTDNLDRVEPRRLSFAEIQAEIGTNEPVGSRVAWFRGNAHFMAIVGWLVAESGEQYLDIADPIFLDSQIPFSAFAGGYKLGGVWSHSYFTRSPPAPMSPGAGGGGPLFASAEDAIRDVDLSSIGA